MNNYHYCKPFPVLNNTRHGNNIGNSGYMQAFESSSKMPKGPGLGKDESTANFVLPIAADLSVINLLS